MSSPPIRLGASPGEAVTRQRTRPVREVGASAVLGLDVSEDNRARLASHRDRMPGPVPDDQRRLLNRHRTGEDREGVPDSPCVSVLVPIDRADLGVGQRACFNVVAPGVAEEQCTYPVERWEEDVQGAPEQGSLCQEGLQHIRPDRRLPIPLFLNS